MLTHWQISSTCVTCHIHMYDMTHVWHDAFVCVCHDASICVTWLIHICDMSQSYVWHDSWISYMAHKLFMCNITHSYVRNDSSTCMTWPIHMCDMTRSYMWHDPFICVTYFWRLMGRISWISSSISFWCNRFLYTYVLWNICMRDMTHLCVCAMTRAYVWHDLFICVTRLIHVRNMTHFYYTWDTTHSCVTWLIRCATWLNHMCEMTGSHVWHVLGA